jgi:hypothetical protein
VNSVKYNPEKSVRFISRKLIANTTNSQSCKSCYSCQTLGPLCDLNFGFPLSIELCHLSFFSTLDLHPTICDHPCSLRASSPRQKRDELPRRLEQTQTCCVHAWLFFEIFNACETNHRVRLSAISVPLWLKYGPDHLAPSRLCAFAFNPVRILRLRG